MRWEKARRVYGRVTEWLWLGLLWVYLFYAFAAYTTMKLPFPAGFDMQFAPVLAGAALLRALPQFRRKTLWAALVLCGAYLLAWGNLQFSFLLYLGIITVGSVGMNHRRLLGCWLSAVGLCLLLTVGGVCSGSVNNLIYEDEGYIKSSMGVIYPTDYASIVLFLSAILWVFWQELPDGVMLLPAGFSLWNAAVVARSQTSTYCSILLIALILCRMLEKHLIERKPGLRWLRRVTDGLLRAAFPACCVLIFTLIWLYGQGNGFADRLNTWMTQRLSLAWQTWQAYGIHALGTAFAQIGNGTAAVFRVNYSFVDISYTLILLRYGWVTLAAVAGAWVWLTHRAIRSGNRRLAFCLALFAVHALSEHHIIEPEYNILLLIPFAALAHPAERPDRVRTREACVRFTFVLLGCAALCLAAPVLFSWLRTIAAQQGWRGTGAALLPILGILLVLLAGFAGLCACLSRLAECAVSRSRLPRTALALGAVFLLALGGGLWHLNRMADQTSPEYEAQMEADAPAIELATWAASGKVYADDMPEWYIRRFGGLTRSALCGDELVRFSPATVITPVDRDSWIYLNAGFLYTPISETHAIYTSDPKVISILSEDGYHLRGYYPGVYTVDAKKEARRNGLTRKSKKILLDGPEQSITSGPYVTLYPGRCVVTYTLHGDPSVWADSEEICDLTVTAAKGAWTYARQTVTKDAFNEKGTAKVSLAFSPWTKIPNFEFLVTAREGKQLEVRKITYQHEPLYDTHKTLGTDHRTAREEYFDLEGNPYWVNDTYTTVTFERDERGNVLEYRYYGPDGEPVLANSGYCSRKMSYNDQNRYIREELYGFDDQLIMIPQGFAVDTFAYDSAGNICEYRYYDTENKLTITTYGYAILRRSYDGNRRITHEAYFDADDKPIMRDWGYAAWDRTYDGAGNVTETIYFDTEGNPVEAPQ